MGSVGSGGSVDSVGSVGSGGTGRISAAGRQSGTGSVRLATDSVPNFKSSYIFGNVCKLNCRGVSAEMLCAKRPHKRKDSCLFTFPGNVSRVKEFATSTSRPDWAHAFGLDFCERQRRP